MGANFYPGQAAPTIPHRQGLSTRSAILIRLWHWDGLALWELAARAAIRSAADVEEIFCRMMEDRKDKCSRAAGSAVVVTTEEIDRRSKSQRHFLAVGRAKPTDLDVSARFDHDAGVAIGSRGKAAKIRAVDGDDHLDPDIGFIAHQEAVTTARRGFDKDTSATFMAAQPLASFIFKPQ